MEKIDLFKLVKCMFTNTQKFESLKNRQLSPHFFMINRFFAINFPTIANTYFNKRGVDGARAIKAWSLVARRYNKVPGWIYTKTKKKKKKKSKKKKKTGFNPDTYEPDDEILSIFLDRFDYGMTEYENALHVNYNKTKKILFDFEKTVKGKI